MISNLIKRLALYLGMSLAPCVAAAQMADNDGLGQTIQINTRFHSFVDKASWLIIIRDIDRGRVFPYVYDITNGQNTWLIFTYSTNYLITVSRMQFGTYRARYNDFRKYMTKDFCHLESHGRIIRNQSMTINIEGDLTPNTGDYACYVSSYADTRFPIVTPSGTI